MKNLLSFGLFIFCSVKAYSQDATTNNCLQYHKGKFLYVDSAGTVIRVVRRKVFQTEYDDSKDVWVNLRIKWITDCEYVLEQVGTNSKSRRKHNHEFYGMVITKSLGTEGYEFTCSCEDQSQKKKFSMTKIK